MHKYRVRISRKRPRKPDIAVIEIERETEQYIWINGRRHSKTGSTIRYLSTWEEATNVLVKAQKEKIRLLERSLASAKHNLYRIYNL